MTSLQHMVISNVLFAGALSLAVLGLTRVWRNRHAAHLLWVIVLAKLVTPPLWNVPIPIQNILGTRPSDVVLQDHSSLGHPMTHPTRRPADASALGVVLTSPETERSRPPLDTGAAFDWSLALMHAWCVSCMLYLLAILWRVFRFQALVRRAEPASAHQRERVDTLSRKIGLRRSPDTRLVNAAISPMVWPLARRRLLLLPKRLVGALTATQLDTVIAHELAHLARRDDLVRFFETAVTCLFWWNPLVWLARRELRAAEEDCCDAIVVCAMPRLRREYGEALLRAAELITFGPSLPALASAIGQQRFLKRRIEVILKHELHRSASRQTKLMLLMFSLGVLPLSATAMSQEEQPRQGAVETDVVSKWQRLGAQLRGPAPETRFDSVLREADRRMKRLPASLQNNSHESERLEEQKDLGEAEKRARAQPRTLWWWKPESCPERSMSPAGDAAIRIGVDGLLHSQVGRSEEFGEPGQTRGASADAGKTRQMGVRKALETLDKRFKDAALENQQMAGRNTLEKTLHATKEGRNHLKNALEEYLQYPATERNVQSPSRQEVRTLHNREAHKLRFVRHVDIADEDINRLADLVEGGVLRIESLRIFSGSITDEGLRQLPRFGNLTALDLSQCSGVSDTGLRYLNELHNLRSLRLDGPVGDEAARQLIFPKLSDFTLTNSWISEPAVAKLLRRLPALRSLYIDGPQFGDNTLAVIAEMDGLETLTTTVRTIDSDDLSLRGSHLKSVRISPESSEGIARLRSLGSMRQLNLTVYPSVNDEVVDQLSQLRQLERFYLNTRGFSDRHLATLKTLTNLEKLSLRGSTVSAEGIARLEREVPNLEVKMLD